MSGSEVSSQEVSTREVSSKHSVIEGCGCTDYRLPGECGGEMRGFQHAYGHGAIVELCDRHFEIAPDPRLIAGYSEEDMLLLCKAWQEKDHQVLAKFARRSDPIGRYYYHDRDGKPIEYHSQKEDVLQETIQAYRVLASLLREIVLNGPRPETKQKLEQWRTRLAELGKKYATILFEEENLHPERPSYQGSDTPYQWRFPGLEEEKTIEKPVEELIRSRVLKEYLEQKNAEL